MNKPIAEYVYGLVRAGDIKHTLPFLIYHHRYISTRRLFDLIAEEIRRGSGTSLQFLISWITYRYRDFRYKMRVKICELALYRNVTDVQPDLNRLKLALIRASSQKHAIPKAIPSQKNRVAALMKGDPLTIAIQLRYVNAMYFMQIPLYSISKRSGFTDRCRKITAWAASAILAQTTYKKQSSVAQQIIGLANFAKELGDYATFWSLMQAFMHHSVNRIKPNWHLPSSVEALAGHFIEIVESTNNYRNYRQELQAAIVSNKVCIPHLYIYHKDLIFIDDGNLDIVNGELNQAKLGLLGSIIHNIRTLQDRAKNIEQVPIYDYILNLPHMSDEALDLRSAELKPVKMSDTNVSGSLVSARGRAPTEESVYVDITESSSQN